MTPEEFLREYESATNSHDIDAVMSLIAKDAIYLFSNESSHVGWEAIRKAIQANFEAIKVEDYRIQNARWLYSSSDVAVSVYEFHWSGEIDGSPASGQGRGTSVIRKVAGRWQVVHEHLSRGGLG